MIKKTLIAMMICLMMMVGVSSARTIEGIELPETLTAGDNLLLLNGGGARVAFMNKVYVAGLWLTRPMTDPAEIKMADEPMAIRMHVTNDFFASSKNINKAFNNGFRSSMPKGDISSIQDKVDRFKACWGDEIKDGDEFDIVYLPGKGVSVYKNGALKDTIEGYEFKQSVWSIWLHDTRPADEDLKKEMVAGNFSDEALQARQQFVASADKAVSEAKAAKEAAMKAAEEAKAKAAAEAKAAEEAALQAAADAKAKAAAEAKAAEKEVKVAAAEAKKEVAAEAKAAKKEVKAAATETKAAVAAGTAVAVTSVKKAADAATKAVAAESRVEGLLTRDNFSDEDVFFGLNSAALNADAKTTLTKKAQWLKSNPVVAVAVEVYCDSRGSAAYNMALAKKRAQSVVDFMTEAGIDASRMEIVVKGAVESSAGTEKAFANNRRAHFVIK